MEDGSVEGEIVYDAYREVAIDGVSSMWDCLTKNERNDGVVWRCLSELYGFVLTASNREACVKLDGIKKTCAVMRLYPENEKVVYNGIRILSGFLDGTLLMKEEVAATGGVAMLCSAVKNNQKNRLVVEFAFDCLEKLSVNEKNDRAMHAIDTAGLIRSTMEMYMVLKDEPVQARPQPKTPCLNVLEHGCLALCKLMSRLQEVRDKAVDSGMAGTLTKVLRQGLETWPKEKNLQTVGFRALRKLELKSLLRALEKHVEEEEVVWRLLKQLHANVQTDLFRERCARDYHGVRPITAAINQHPDELLVQLWGARVLAKLVLCEAPPVLGSTLGLVQDSKSKGKTTDVKVLLRQNDAVTVLITAMQCHEDRPEVQAPCCDALALLALDRTNAQLIQEADGCAQLVQALVRFPHDPAVCEHAMSALGALGLRYALCREELCEMGALEACADALKAHPERHAVVHQGLQAVAHLVWPRAAVQERARLCGLDACARRAMREYTLKQQGYSRVKLSPNVRAFPDGQLVASKASRLGTMQLLDFECPHHTREIFHATALGARAYLQAVPASVTLSAVQAVGVRALRALHMHAAPNSKEDMPYTPYGGFDVVPKMCNKIG